MTYIKEDSWDTSFSILIDSHVKSFRSMSSEACASWLVFQRSAGLYKAIFCPSKVILLTSLEQFVSFDVHEVS